MQCAGGWLKTTKCVGIQTVSSVKSRGTQFGTEVSIMEMTNYTQLSRQQERELEHVIRLMLSASNTGEIRIGTKGSVSISFLQKYIHF